MNRVLTYGDLAFIEGALALLLWDGQHKWAAIPLGFVGGINFLLHAAALARDKSEDS